MILTNDEILSTLILNNKDKLIDRVPNLTDEQKQQAKDFFKKYSNYENKIDWNKLKSLTWKDFEDVFELASQSKSAKKSDLRSLFNGDEFIILNEDDNFIYVAPLSYDSAKYMDSYQCGGQGARWCIGWNDTKEYWNQYRRDGDVFCLVIAKPNSSLSIFDAINECSPSNVTRFERKKDIYEGWRDAIGTPQEKEWFNKVIDRSNGCMCTLPSDNKVMIQIEKYGNVKIWSQICDNDVYSNTLDSLSNTPFNVPTDVYDTVKSEVDRVHSEKKPKCESEYGRALLEFLGDGFTVEMLHNNEHFWESNDGREWSVFTDEEAYEEWRCYLLEDANWWQDFGESAYDYIKEDWFEDCYEEDCGHKWDESMDTDDKIRWILANTDVEETSEYFELEYYDPSDYEDDESFDPNEDIDVDLSRPKFDLDDYREDYVDSEKDSFDGCNSASEWYREVFGESSFVDAIDEYDLFDADSWIEYEMRCGNRGERLSSYNGYEEYVDTDDGTFYIYRQN